MSTILDALRRVEGEEGSAEPQPALDGDLLGAPPEDATAVDASAEAAPEAAPDLEPEALAQAAPARDARPAAPPRPHPSGTYPESISIWPWAMAVAVGVLLVASGSWLLAAKEPAGPTGIAPAEAAPSEPAAATALAGTGASVQPATGNATAAELPAMHALDPASVRFAQARMREAIGADEAGAAADAPGLDAKVVETQVALAPARDPVPKRQVATAPAPRQSVDAKVDPPAPTTTRVARAAAPAEERVARSEAPVQAERTLPIAETFPVTESAPVPAKVAEPPATHASARSSADPVGEALPPRDVEVLEPPPEIRIARTRWHPTPERRTAEIEVAGTPHEVHEGDQIDTLRVSEIRPSGVVFVHEGIRLDRKIGSR